MCTSRTTELSNSSVAASLAWRRSRPPRCSPSWRSQFPTPVVVGRHASAILAPRSNSGGVKSLQLGLGRSMIVDLSEDARKFRRRSQDRKRDRSIRPADLHLDARSRSDDDFRARGEWPQDRGAGNLGRSRRRRVDAVLKAAIPDNDIHVRTVADSIILTGSVASAGDARRLSTSPRGSLRADRPRASAAGGAATETTRQSRELADDTWARSGEPAGDDHRNSTPDHQATRRQPGRLRQQPQLQRDQPVLGQRSESSTSRHRLGDGGRKLTATLQAFEQQGVARTLAEPTVTAVSGERAKFLAGGTIPIPVRESCSAGICCVLSYVQQPYGVTLNFTPVVLSQGRIQLRIGTEVTDIDTRSPGDR